MQHAYATTVQANDVSQSWYIVFMLVILAISSGSVGV